MKKLTFKQWLLLLCGVYAVLIAVGLAIFWGWLGRYEAHHPVGAMNTYFEQLKSGKTAEIIQNSEFPFDTFNTESIYIQYLSDKYMNGEGKWQYADVDTDPKDGVQTYDVYENNQKYGTLYLTETDDGKYRVRSDWAYAYETVMVSPEVPQVNGAAAHPEGEAKTVDVFAQVSGSVPTVTQYRVKILLKPQITLTGGDAVTAETDSGVRVTLVPTAADDTALRTAAETAARTYACFISGDLKLEDMNALIENGTPFAKGIRSYDPKWYNQHKSVAFENMDIKTPVRWSDDAFSVQVTFDFVVSRGYDLHTYPTKYDIAFRRINGGFKVTNIVPL